MKYGLITIDTPSSNRGNRLIEWALKRVLNLPEPAEIASMFAPLSGCAVERLNACDFALLAGSTILADAPGNSDAMRSLHLLKVPVFCASGSGWAPYADYLPLDVLRHITPPIGVRDPHALTYCEKIKLEAELVGCPTAYVNPIDSVQRTHTVVGFGRHKTDWQMFLFSALQDLGFSVAVASQEEAFSVPLARRLNAPCFTYDNPGEVYEVYAHTEKCFTGRLHGVLPAMSQNVPVCFFGDAEDSRFSLLGNLGVPVCPLKTETFPSLVYPAEYAGQLAALKSSFLDWASRTIGQYI